MPGLAVKQAPLHERLNMTREQLELIRSMCIREDAPDNVLELYLYRCRSVGVDPMDKMIYVIPRKKNVQDATGHWRSEISWTFQSSIDLFRSIAEQSEDYAGQLGPFWTSDGVKWVDVWLSEEPPLACRVGVLRNSFKEPLWVTGTYAYYVPRDRSGKPEPTAFWKGEKGAHQLAKCVEELALRKAFPRKLHGIYGSDEMAQAERPPSSLKAAPERKEEAQEAQFAELPPAPVEPAPGPPPTNDGFPSPKDCSILARNRGLSDALYRSTILELFGDREWPNGKPSSTALSQDERRKLYDAITERTAEEVTQ